LLPGAGEVFGGQRIQREVFHPARAGVFHKPEYALHAGLVTGRTGQKAALCPPPVAVHYYAYACGNLVCHQTVIISFSFSDTAASVFATASATCFSTSFSKRANSSSEMALSAFSFLSASIASLRTLRSATLASSPILRIF